MSKIVIAGAGLAGLVTANGLRASHEVIVIDPDKDAAATSGYRIHIDEHAMAALRRRLPKEPLAKIRTAGEDESSLQTFSVFSPAMSALLVFPNDDVGPSLLIDRRILRTLLAESAGNVWWGNSVIEYEERDKEVSVLLEDGRRLDCDLLVGADGTNSTIARQVMGRLPARPTGTVAIAGESPTTTETIAAFAPDLLTGPGFAVDSRGLGAFFSFDRADRHRPRLLWSVARSREAFRGDPLIMNTRELREEVRYQTRTWSPELLTITANADANSLAAFPFWRPATPWVTPTPRVAVIGDAVHPMPPTGGAGGSTAIRDADHLVEAVNNDGVMGAASSAYREMLSYAPSVVDESLNALRWQSRISGKASYWTVRASAIPACRALLATRRHVAAVLAR